MHSRPRGGGWGGGVEITEKLLAPGFKLLRNAPLSAELDFGAGTSSEKSSAEVFLFDGALPVSQ